MTAETQVHMDIPDTHTHRTQPSSPLLSTENPPPAICFPVYFQKALELIPAPITEPHVEMSSTGEQCGRPLTEHMGEQAYTALGAWHNSQCTEDSWSDLLGIASP